MTRRAAPMIAIIAVSGVALTAWPAAAEINPGQQEGLGLTARDVPAVLQKARTAPYAPATCEAAYAEVAALDQVLGPDADEPEGERNNAGALLIKGARSLIPYREVFRVITGVDRKERELTEAAMAGWARRGFLKGYLRGECSAEPATIAASVDVASTPAIARTPVPLPVEPLPVEPPSGDAAATPAAPGTDLPSSVAAAESYQTAEVHAPGATALEAEN